LPTLSTICAELSPARVKTSAAKRIERIAAIFGEVANPIRSTH
jgi:hypothetical protein